jgi:hypothetical protein
MSKYLNPSGETVPLSGAKFICFVFAKGYKKFITNPRQRHQTLAYGVSELDLDRARSTLGLDRGAGVADPLISWRGSNRDLRGNPTGGAPAFQLGRGGAGGGYAGYSKSALDLGYSSQPPSRRDSFTVSISSLFSPRSSPLFIYPHSLFFSPILYIFLSFECVILTRQVLVIILNPIANMTDCITSL